MKAGAGRETQLSTASNAITATNKIAAPTAISAELRIICERTSGENDERSIFPHLPQLNPAKAA